ncbi:MAG TPA: hypothetical protein VED40_18835 [Azospirillaceae bacterium]|nr:hypothetical protein [Azospirillaceae bacterium]
MPAAEATEPDEGARAEPKGDAGRGAVFSSRAVRDAAVVTTCIDALRRYVAGDEPIDQLMFKLQSLSGEQSSFLQISLEPGLLDQAMARTADQRSPQAAALRRMLVDLSGGEGPGAAAASAPSGTTAAAPLAAMTGPRPPRPTLPIPPRPAAPPAAQPVPQPETAPAAATAAVFRTPDPVVSVMPEIPAALSSEEEAPTPVPPPPPRPPVAAPSLPRLPRDAAEARRARLFDSISDNVP